jgi:hypothetical protein
MAASGALMKLAQLRRSIFIPKGDRLAHLRPVQQFHGFSRVARPEFRNRMSRNGDAPLLMNLLNRLGRGQTPADRRVNSRGDQVVLGRNDLFAYQYRWTIDPPGKLARDAAGENLIVTGDCDRVQALLPSLDHDIPGSKHAGAEWESVDMKIHGEHLVSA